MSHCLPVENSTPSLSLNTHTYTNTLTRLDYCRGTLLPVISCFLLPDFPRARTLFLLFLFFWFCFDFFFFFAFYAPAAGSVSTLNTSFITQLLFPVAENNKTTAGVLVSVLS